MSALLSNLNTDASLEDEKDILGGGGPLDTDVYGSEITMAYLDKSQGGALGLNLHLKTDQGREIRETLWVASGDAKGNKTYFENKQGEKKPLPGFTNATAMCLLTVGKELGEMDTESKVVKVYSREAQAEVPQTKEVLVDLLGQRIKVGLFKQTIDKRAKGDDGNYAPTGETRDVNEIDKFFRDRDGMTTAEIRAQADEAVFMNTWKDKWAGQVRDRTSKDAPQGGTAGLPRQAANSPAGAGAAAASSKPKQSLFG